MTVALNLVRHRMEITCSTSQPPMTRMELDALVDQAAMLIRTIERAEAELLAAAADRAVCEHMQSLQRVNP